MSKRNGLKANKQDTLEDVIDKNDMLSRRLTKLERENKKLKSENKTLQNAWHKTEEYLVAISENKTIKTIFEEIDTKTNLKKVRKNCPNTDCANKTLNKRIYDGYSVLSCFVCGYRNRVNEKGSPVS